MSNTSTHLLLPYLLAAQAQKHVTVNEALRLLDGLVQLAVLDRHLTAPPASSGSRAIDGFMAQRGRHTWGLHAPRSALWQTGCQYGLYAAVRARSRLTGRRDGALGLDPEGGARPAGLAPTWGNARIQKGSRRQRRSTPPIVSWFAAAHA